MNQNREKGIITVYLTLILLILLALITTVMESARLSAARAYAELIATTAVDSVLAEYYLPLYDEYHVFALDAGYGSYAQSTETMESKLTEYMNSSFSPVTMFGSSGFNMWQFGIDAATVTEKASLISNDGAFFRQQAVEYMKYREISLVAEKLLSSLDVLKKADATTALLKVKSGVEETLSSIDTCVLKLFEKIDGIVSDLDGIKKTWGGDLKFANYFAKKLFIGTPTPESVSVEQAQIFAALRSEYQDPLLLIEGMKADGSEYIRYQQEAEELTLLAQNTDDLLLSAKYRVQAGLKATKGFEYYSEISSYQTSLQTLNRGCLAATREALLILTEIEVKQTIAQSSVWVYEDKLLGAVEWLDKDLYKELNSSLKVMKQYIGEEVDGVEAIYDLAAMKKTLQANKIVLEQVSSLLISCSLTMENQQSWFEMLETVKQGYASYSYTGLMFDYSNMQISATGESPTDFFSSLVAGGLGDLVINDYSLLSNKDLPKKVLPSLQLSDMQAEEETEEINTGSTEGIFQMFQGGLSLSEAGNILKEGASVLTEKLLFLSYLTDHFSDYKTAKLDNTAMQYELEYILCGKYNDTQNMEAITTKIILVRALLCLIHVLGDSEKGNEAKLFATTVLGFTGMPVLISILQFLILFIWAFEEALVETAAILQGKQVELMPTKANFSVKFAEIPVMLKPLIQSKATAWVEGTGVKFGYKEYLLIFLLLQNEKDQNLRAMDLIQENLRLNYEDTFLIKNSIYGFNVEVDLSLPAMFISLPFSRKEGKDILGYRYKICGGGAY